MTTNVYDAKEALFVALDALTATGQPLEGLQVAYAYPASNVDAECVYGGGVRFEQRDAVAEQPGIMVLEEAIVTVYIRVVARPPGPVQDTDQRCAAIGAAIGTMLRTQPTLAGGNAVVGIARGQGDYHQTDDETVSILSYQIRVQQHLTYGSA